MKIEKMDKFEDVLQHLLTVVESNPDMPVEEAIKIALADLNMDKESVSEIEKSFKTLDDINEKAISLAEAREEGVTRNTWIQQQLGDIAEKAGDARDNILSVIERGVDMGLEETLKQESND